MSVLPPQVHAELTELLQALQSSDNNVRSQAEEHLTNNWTNTRPEMLLMGLVEQIHGSNNTSVSATLVRCLVPRFIMHATKAT
jgi:importin-5